MLEKFRNSVNDIKSVINNNYFNSLILLDYDYNENYINDYRKNYFIYKIIIQVNNNCNILERLSWSNNQKNNEKNIKSKISPLTNFYYDNDNYYSVYMINDNINSNDIEYLQINRWFLKYDADNLKIPENIIKILIDKYSHTLDDYYPLLGEKNYKWTFLKNNDFFNIQDYIPLCRYNLCYLYANINSISKNYKKIILFNIENNKISSYEISEKYVSDNINNYSQLMFFDKSKIIYNSIIVSHKNNKNGFNNSNDYNNLYELKIINQKYCLSIFDIFTETINKYFDVIKIFKNNKLLNRKLLLNNHKNLQIEKYKNMKTIKQILTTYKYVLLFDCFINNNTIQRFYKGNNINTVIYDMLNSDSFELMNLISKSNKNFKFLLFLNNINISNNLKIDITFNSVNLLMISNNKHDNINDYSIVFNNIDFCKYQKSILSNINKDTFVISFLMNNNDIIKNIKKNNNTVFKFHFEIDV